MGAVSILVLLVWMFILYINESLVMRSATPRSNGVLQFCCWRRWQPCTRWEHQAEKTEGVQRQVLSEGDVRCAKSVPRNVKRNSWRSFSAWWKCWKKQGPRLHHVPPQEQERYGRLHPDIFWAFISWCWHFCVENAWAQMLVLKCLYSNVCIQMLVLSPS